MMQRSMASVCLAIGDVNNDGCVNFSDLNEVLSSFGVNCD
jgi:hypothetical protein